MNADVSENKITALKLFHLLNDLEENYQPIPGFHVRMHLCFCKATSPSSFLLPHCPVFLHFRQLNHTLCDGRLTASNTELEYKVPFTAFSYLPFHNTRYLHREPSDLTQSDLLETSSLA